MDRGVKRSNAMRNDSDEALVDRARRGDEPAFASLVERHYGTIYRIAYKWCGERADAEDVAQEVCIKLARALATFRGEARFSTWVTRMTINAVQDLCRARARRRRDVTAMALVEGESLAPEPCHGVAAAELWRAVRELPAKQRDCVLLVYGEGMNHGQAAAVLGCGASTVSWHVHEARKRLKRRLED